jgi:hypothetical protein
MLSISHSSVLPSTRWNGVGALISDLFRGSITLPACLSTLHVQPCDYPHMTRGQVGSLRLTCTTLSFATSRRFIPAHSNCVQNSAFYRGFAGWETRKLNCINRVYGAGDANRTHVRTLGVLNVPASLPRGQTNLRPELAFWTVPDNHSREENSPPACLCRTLRLGRTRRFGA